MTRVSLKEAYDNKDVVAQIYAIRDIAEGAKDTANGAVSTANTASEHVDALVPQVEGAVQNANNASSSAQASAQTVAGYENRVTALETADGQNVKLSGDQGISGIKTVPTEATGSRSQQIANSAKVGAELDNYSFMLRTTGSQIKAGPLELIDPLTRSGVSGGRTAFNITDASGNCYVFTVRDSNNKSRGSMNHQTIMSGDRATRNTLTVQSDDYSATDQTGAVGTLTLEVLPSGQLKITAAVVTGDGKKASQTIATLQAV